MFESKEGSWRPSVICIYNVGLVRSLRANDRFHNVIAIDKWYAQVSHILACFLIYV